MAVRTALRLLLLGALLPWVALAQEQYDERDLAKESITFAKEDTTGFTSQEVKWTDLVSNQEKKIGVADCAVKTGNARGVLEAAGKACGGLWQMESPVDLTVSGKLTDGTTKTYTVKRRAPKLQQPAAGQGPTLTTQKTIAAGDAFKNKGVTFRLVFNDGTSRWLTRTANAKGEVDIADVSANLNSNSPTHLYAEDAAGQYSSWPVTREGADAQPQVNVTGTPFSPTVLARGGPLGQATSYRCHDVNPDQEDLQIICADARQSRITITRTPSQHIVRPNRGFLVAILHQPQHEVQVSIDGEPGLYEAPLRMQTDPNDRSLQSGGVTLRPVVTVYTFAPRRPGNVNVIISMFENGRPVSERRVELIVEQTYSGAVRFGIATIGGGAVDRSYDARTLPSSAQAEVVQTSHSTVDLELVIGFAPFLEQAWGGRGYASSRRLSEAPFGFSPFVGVGILNENRNALELLKSLHLGVEWEINPHFSLAATYVLRRVDRLAPGLTVGAPVGPDGVLTTSTYQSGWGVVLNVSPEFLRFARREGSSFF